MAGATARTPVMHVPSLWPGTERVAALVAGRAHRGEHRKPGQAVAFIAHGIPVTRPATIGRGLTRQLPVLVAAVAAGAVRIVAAGAMSWLAVEAFVLGRGPGLGVAGAEQHQPGRDRDGRVPGEH